MDTICSKSDEMKMHHAYLFSEIGKDGSGYIRYAAAMYFYNQGKLSAEMLEIYRRCCKFDKEDPIDLAHFEDVKMIPTQYSLQ